MDPVRAWLLDSGEIYRIAVGERELIEVLQDAPVSHVPCGPRHFRNVIVWRGRIIPALDLGGFGANPGETVRRKAAVAAYQIAPGEPLQYGAILLNKYPQSIRVDDSMALTLTLDCAPLANCVSACFEWDEGVVLVIDPARLFGSEPKNPQQISGEKTVACVIDGPTVDLNASLPI
jgi:chemotaxis signal transduction protein